MKRILLVCLLVVSVAGGLAAQRSVAQEPADILDHFRLIPRLSTLRQTGGFAGVDLRYRLTGEYDLRRGTRLNRMAAFENAEVWGSLISDLPTPAVVIDVDEILNLEGLKGTALPVAAPFDIYRFEGLAPDESSVELFAAVLGRWMFIRGGTQPPPGSADFFEYHIRALARSGPAPFADINEDGSVDAADYVAWRDSVRTSGDDGSAGYADWRHQFGEAVPDMAAIDVAMSSAMASFVAAASVPEPTCLNLAIGAGFLIAGRRRRADRASGAG
jgi:hypothetical protein